MKPTGTVMTGRSSNPQTMISQDAVPSQYLIATVEQVI